MLVRHCLLHLYSYGLIKLGLHLSLLNVHLVGDEQLGLNLVLLLELFPHLFHSQLGSDLVLGFFFSLSQL